MAERFWENLSIILAERNISWIELTRKMFAGEFHYPSELNRLYQKIRHYKMEQRMPQSPWVERIVMKIYFGGNYEKNNSSLYIPTSKCPIGISILTEISLYR